MYQKIDLRIFLFFVVLFSCSPTPSKTRIQFVHGGVETVLPFYVKNGFRFIQLSLAPDQKPIRFLVDTGSRFSFLDERYFTENDSKRRIAVTYPGGKDDSYRRIRTVKLFHNLDPIFKDITVYSHTFSGNLELDGIIGMDSLYDKIIILEYPNQIRFLQAADGKLIESMISDLPGLMQNAEPLRFFSGLPVLETSYGTNDKALLILDTGAESSLLELPKPLPGFVEETFSSRSVPVLNFQGKFMNIRTQFVRKLCLIQTSTCVENLEILPSGLPVDFSGTPTGVRIQGVLGVNWLNEHRILLDMKRSLIGIVGKDGGK
ncbi:retropepsin-like aspartic protease [Leptospira alstonii]|nr:retropepsin-like aspartic protease [Leptospira alstonii]